MITLKKNITIETKSFGTLELRPFTISDVIAISGLMLGKGRDDRKLVLMSMHRQIISPNLTKEEFKEISDGDGAILLTAFMSNEKSVFEHRKHTSDIYRDFREAVKEYHDHRIKNALNMSPAFAAANRRYKSIIDSIATLAGNSQREYWDSLKPQIEYLQNWAKSNQQIFAKFWESWAESEKENRIAEKQVVTVLRKYKWFVCPSMPYVGLRTILVVARMKGRKDAEINRLFIDYFERNDWANLASMVDSWDENPLFKPRMPIIKGCVKTMQMGRSGRYNACLVVLPTLISQLDGLVTDYLKKHNIPFKGAFSDQSRGRKSQFRANSPQLLPEDLNELAMDIFLNILFQRSQPGKPLATPFNFNRHKIMHGESMRFGRKDYVIRAFMVLDLLACLK